MKRKTTEQFIKECRIIHGNRYNYSKVEYIHSKTNVIIACKIHGEFEQTPDKHLTGRNCVKCSILIRAAKRKLSNKEVIRRAVKIHGDKYDYSLVNHTEYHTKICIICPIHGSFQQTPFQHIYKKCGCKKCFNETKAKPINQFIIDAGAIHNNRYAYSLIHKEYKNARSKVRIICNKHGVFQQTINNHLRGRGCPKCKYKTQTYIYNVCQEMFPDYDVKYSYRKFNWLRISKYGTLELDIYVPEIKLAIEYDGEQHFKPVCFGSVSLKKAKRNFSEIQKRDEMKNKLILMHSKDIKYFIRFSYKELPLKQEYIKTKIKNLINNN